MLDRLSLLLSENKIMTIKKLNILIVGIGGVGGYVLESLIRSGVENITIVDKDCIDISNLNRQILALNSNLKQLKVDVAKKRALDINPNVKINTLNIFLNKDNIDDLDYSKYDYIVDACDTITTKLLLIKKAQDNNTSIISCMGTGNRFNPELLTITKLSKTYNDPIAKVLRKLIKEEKLNDPLVCWSREIPQRINSRTPGSAIFVPATAGLLISSYIISKIKNNV